MYIYTYTYYITHTCRRPCPSPAPGRRRCPAAGRSRRTPFVVAHLLYWFIGLCIWFSLIVLCVFICAYMLFFTRTQSSCMRARALFRMLMAVRWSMTDCLYTPFCALRSSPACGLRGLRISQTVQRGVLGGLDRPAPKSRVNRRKQKHLEARIRIPREETGLLQGDLHVQLLLLQVRDLLSGPGI